MERTVCCVHQEIISTWKVIGRRERRCRPEEQTASFNGETTSQTYPADDLIGFTCGVETQYSPTVAPSYQYYPFPSTNSPNAVVLRTVFQPT